MTSSAGSEQSRALREHRARINKLLWAEGDHGFEKATWYEGIAFLDDGGDDDDIFPVPDRPLPTITITPPSPSITAPTPSPLTPPPPPPSPRRTAPPRPTIPNQVRQLASYINQLPKKRDGWPSRNKLRKDNHLRGEINRKTGYLRIEKRNGQLRRFRGDDRLFTAEMWRYLAGDEEGDEDDGA